MKRIKNFFLSWFPAVLWMTAIFYFSSRPRFSIIERNLFLDFVVFKLLHMIEYGLLYFLLLRAFFKTTRVSLSVLFFSAFAMGFLYALSDEYHQSHVPTREGKLRDVIIDMAGMFVVYWYMRHHIGRVTKYLK